jgi:hypothetical protein
MHGDTVAMPPSMTEQINWFRKQLSDADQLRQILLRSGNLDPDRADRDAEMWNAVLATLQAFAELDGKAK